MCYFVLLYFLRKFCLLLCNETWKKLVFIVIVFAYIFFNANINGSLTNPKLLYQIQVNSEFEEG